MPLTIMLADDHHVVRQGLQALLRAEQDFQLVGETANGLEVPRLVEKLRPHVLVLDLMMPGLGGLEITRRVTQRTPETRVVILSMHANEAYVVEAFRAGAIGYVLKGSTSVQLVRAIREAAAGRRFLSPPLSEDKLEEYLLTVESVPFDSYETLTSREREVLQLAAEGNSNSEIGHKLHISTRTVETHRANLMRKLGIHTQSELIRFALRKGILPIEQ